VNIGKEVIAMAYEKKPKKKKKPRKNPKGTFKC
jgi:hypothetical protein